jgi:hypothetical protein
MTADEKTTFAPRDRWEVFGLIIVLGLVLLVGLAVVVLCGRWDAALS